MKSMRIYVQSLSLVSVLLSLASIFTALAPPASLAQTAPPNDNNNAPPFDFNNAFYTLNGINVDQLNTPAAGRFGLFRKTGPPAGNNQVNWVIDGSNTDPVRNSVRILATTGGYKDDTGSPTQFISIIAFLTSQDFFTGAPNARGITTEQIAGVPNNNAPGASAFEAYAGVKQIGPGGIFLPAPCASIGIPNGVPGKDCFSVASVATPNLRQDWRFSTNRSAIDGSANFSYNGDNLLGLWIITYHWYTAAGFGPQQTPDCKAALAFLAARNGLTLDGTPLIKTGAELYFVENNLQGNEVNDFPPPPSNACAAEGNLDPSVGDSGAVWLVCPSIPDPTRGGIALDAFADVVRKQDGSPLDPQITASFNCLQKNGDFCALANGTYTVKNQASGLFWDGAVASGGTGVQLAALNTASTGTSQQWTFTVNLDGTYTVTNKATRLALSDPPANGAPGKRLVLSPFDGDSNQKWIVTPLNNGYRITNVFTKLAVDATTVVPSPGTSIVHATPTGDSEQVWVIH